MFKQFRILLKKKIPFIYKLYMKYKKQKAKHPLTLEELRNILHNVFKIKQGDVIFVHTSFSYIDPVDFEPEDVIELLKEIVGSDGTVAMPSFVNPKRKNYREEIFNVKKTMGSSGLINELFRMSPGTVRSPHPVRSVVAWGKHAEYLTCEHHKSTYSFDEDSPFYKLVLLKAKIFGIGTDFRHFSFIHTVEDMNLELFPPLYTDTYPKTIILKDKTQITGEYAHSLNKLTQYNSFENIRKYFDKKQLFLHKCNSIPFFYADATYAYNKGVELAEKGRTIYGRYNLKGDYLN